VQPILSNFERIALGTFVYCINDMQRDIGRSHLTNGSSNGVSGHSSLHLELDAVIVGGGFAGVYLLHRLRQEGFNVKLLEAGTALGGIWHWNSYPGARVDSMYPVYALSIPEVYKTWTWSEKYPGEKELKRYFQHVDKVLDISKDVLYEHRVVAAGFDPQENKWHLECENGTRVTARFFLGCLGFAAKRYFPEWEGLENFKGYMCHSSFWPAEGVDMKGKRVGVVGTGATGIQIAQTVAPEVKELTCFVRTPNLCIRMNQGPIHPDQQEKDMEYVEKLLSESRYENVAGFLYSNATKGVLEDSLEEREKVLQGAWDRGGFEILFTYKDIVTDQEANDEVYKFWVNKTRSRISDPEKRDLLAPVTPPHPFGGKRPSLEQDYYEQMDKPHVKLVNLKKNPVEKAVENGIVTADGKLHEFDVLAIATGFDSVTGGYKHLDVTGLDDSKLVDKMGPVYTYLGMSVSGFPNFFFTYGPQSPTAYANGPTLVEPQGEWIVSVVKKMRDQGLTRINANENAEQKWRETIRDLHKLSLRDKVDGWYMGKYISSFHFNVSV
jgi:cation diffusion facilitator CzcD-associated flavoprotein CzcO